MDAVHAGKIFGMYIMGENPAMSDPDVGHAREALARLDHLVVQDIFLTETAMYADVILPASAWPEKDGTVSNTNRQVQMGRKALEPPGETRPDWWITIEIARRMGLPWTYQGPADVFAEMKLAMPSLDNIDWERLMREISVTYPCLAPDRPGEDIVFADRFPTESGLGKMVPAEIVPPREEPDREYPFILSTGRQLEHWHTGAMTRRASSLDAIEPSATAQLNPATIAKLRLRPGDRIRVISRRGRVELQARADEGVPPNVVVHPVRLRGGGGQPADHSRPRSLRKDPRVQILRGEGRGGEAAPARGGGVSYAIWYCHSCVHTPLVRAGLDPAILFGTRQQCAGDHLPKLNDSRTCGPHQEDGRVKPGHDGWSCEPSCPA